jgi:uncharacterized protein YkwD
MKKIILLLFLSLISCEKEQIEKKYTPKQVEYTGYQLEVLNELNSIRLENNSNILIPEERLTIGCKSHALYMYATNTMSHDYFWSRFIQSESVKFGEIVAQGFITPIGEISGFESSPPHRIAMLNPEYKYCGIYKEGSFLCINLASYDTTSKQIIIKTYKINNNLSLKKI